MDIAVHQLQLRLRAHGQRARAAWLIEDALRTASLPGLPRGARVAVRRFDLGPLSLSDSPQALARRIDARLLALTAALVRVDHPAAAQADAVWADDTIAAVATATATAVQAGPAAAMWWWPLLVPGWRPTAARRDALAQMLHAAAQALPDPLRAQRRWLAALPPGVLAALLDQLDATLVARWSPAPVQPPAVVAPTAWLPAPPSLHAAARRRGAADAVARWLAAVWSSDAATPAALASADRAAAQLAAWSAPDAGGAAMPTAVRSTRAASPTAAATGVAPDVAAPASRSTARRASPVVTAPRSSPVTGHRRPSHAQPPTRVSSRSAKAHPAAEGPLPTLQRSVSQAVPWAGAPSANAGAALLINLLHRAGLASAVPMALAAALHRLARAGGVQARAVPAWLPAAGDDQGLAQRARRWLRAADRRVRGPGEQPLTLRRLVRRPGAERATATHLDVTFALRDSDIRVRRLGLDLDPGWVPWLGLVVAVHFVSDAGNA